MRPGNDMRFYWERVEASRNFANKVWNASRFIMMNIDEGKCRAHEQSHDRAYAKDADASLAKEESHTLTLADKWILSQRQHAGERCDREPR